MGKGFSLTNIEDLTPEQAIDYFKGLPGFEHISGQIREREMGFNPEALAKAQRLQKEKNKKALAASVTGIVSPEEEFALKGKEAQEERGVKPGGFFGTADLSREAQEDIGEEVRIRQEEDLKPDPLERDIEVSDYEGPLSPFQMFAAEAEVANYFTGKVNNAISNKVDEFTFGLGSKALRVIPGINVPFMYTDMVKPSEKTGEILAGDLNWEEKARALATVNEERPFHEELLTGLFAPTSIVTMPIVGTSKAVTKTAQYATDFDIFKTIIDNVPAVLINNPDAAIKTRAVKQDVIAKVFNQEIKLPNMPEGSFFENDLRFWINMPENQPVNMARYTANITRTAGPDSVIHLAETNGTLQRLMDVGLIVRDDAGNYYKSVMSGDNKAVELLGNWGKQIGVEGASDANIFVGDLPTLKSAINQIVTIENKPLQLLLKSTGINPSVAATTPMEKLVIGYARLGTMASDMAEIALQGGLDSHVSKWRGKLPVTIDKDGIVEGTGTHWLDVFSNPAAFKEDLSTEAMRYIEDYIRIVDEMEKLRLSHGLPPLTKDRNGLFYIPRHVVGIDDIDKLREAGKSISDSHMPRKFDLATGGRVGRWSDEVGDWVGETYYEVSPRQNLKLHLNAAYRELLQEELSKELMESGLAISGREIMQTQHKKLYDGFEGAKKAYLASIKELRRVYSEEASAYTAASKKALAPRIEKAKNDRSAAWRQLKEIKTRYNSKLKDLRIAANKDKGALVSGGLWGEIADKQISVREWRGKFYKAEDYDALKKGVGQLVGKGAGWTELLGNSINTSRWLQSNADFGAPFIHGLPTLTRNPKAWARAFWGQAKAFAMPGTQAQFVRTHLKTFQEMAQHGVPVGDVEMFAAMQKGQGLSPGAILTFLPDERGASLLGRVLGDKSVKANGEDLKNLDRILLGIGRKGTVARRGAQASVNQTLGRFQASYSMMLAMNRALLWEAMSPWWTQSKRAGNSLDELGAYIRNMTGGLDTKALGVSTSQRNIEGAWLAFSPKLLRSTIALIWDAMNYVPAEGRRIITGQSVEEAGATMRQKEAARSLALLLTGVHGLYVTAAVANGAAKGHSMERISNDIGQGINPLNGKKYLSIEVDGQWYGVGGQVRAITQLYAGVVSSLAPGGEPIQNLKSFDMSNPILRFMAFRGSVAQDWARTIREGASGGEVDALQFGHVDGYMDIPVHIGESSLPFIIQGLIEGDNVFGAALGAMGFRSSPTRGKDDAESLIKDMWFNMSPEELAKFDHKRGEFPANWKRDLDRRLLNEMQDKDPRIEQALERHSDELLEMGSPFEQYKKDKQEFKTTRDTKIEDSLNTVGVGADLRTIIKTQFRNYVDDSMDLDISNKDLLKDFEDLEPSAQPYNMALDKYWEVMSADQIEGYPPLEDTTTGAFNFEELERRLAELAEDEIVGPYLGAIESNKYEGATPVVRELLREFDRDKEILRTYWEIPDNIITGIGAEETWEKYSTMPVSKIKNNVQDFRIRAIPEYNWTEQDAENLDAILLQINANRLNMRQGNDPETADIAPVLDLLLFKWGYVTQLEHISAETEAEIIKFNRPGGVWMPTSYREDINTLIQENFDSSYNQIEMPEPVGAR